MPSLPSLYTVSEVAKALRISTKALKIRIDRGEINPLRIGRLRRFSAAQVNDIITNGTVWPPKPELVAAD